MDGVIARDRVSPQPPLPELNPHALREERRVQARDAHKPLSRLSVQGREEQEADRSEPACGECGLRVAEAEWTYVRSPKETWARKCGREGWLAVCPQHRTQITFVIIRMN